MCKVDTPCGGLVVDHVVEIALPRWLAWLGGLSARSRSLPGLKRTERLWGTVTLDRSRSASDRGPTSWPGRDA